MVTVSLMMWLMLMLMLMLTSMLPQGDTAESCHEKFLSNELDEKLFKTILEIGSCVFAMLSSTE